MDAPYCHRDFKTSICRSIDEEYDEQLSGKWTVFGFEQPHSALDVVGWDGSVYPWVFHFGISASCWSDTSPTNLAWNFFNEKCTDRSFVPRSVDFHPETIPCPYPHSSVDCDEFYFTVGVITSKAGPGSVSLHPMGLPHGPHPFIRSEHWT